MFSLFKKKDQGPTFRDWVWATDKAYWLQMLATLGKATASEPVWVVSSFPDNLKALAEKLDKMQVAYKTVSYTSDLDPQVPVCLLQGSWLMQWQGALQAMPQRRIFFMEHYPLPVRDTELRTRAANQLGTAQLYYFISLEGPMIQLFGGERIVNMLQQLGMNPEELIEHNLISQSFKQAQEKVAKKVGIEKPANSEAEWFRINYKG